VSEDLKQNLTASGTWQRLLYMILFAVVFNIVEVVLGLVALVQFAFKLVTGEADDRLRSFGVSLGIYVRQVVRFQTFVSDEPPFPFAPWPENDEFDAPSGRVLPSMPGDR
jgi:hypothetical protein